MIGRRANERKIFELLRKDDSQTITFCTVPSPFVLCLFFKRERKERPFCKLGVIGPKMTVCDRPKKERDFQERK